MWFVQRRQWLMKQCYDTAGDSTLAVAAGAEHHASDIEHPSGRAHGRVRARDVCEVYSI